MKDQRIDEIRALLPRAMLPDWVRLGSRMVRLLRDTHHPQTHDALINRILEQARASVALREERKRHLPALQYPPELPITGRKQEIVDAIRANQVVVIAGETGSGKTTQIPKMCLEAGLGIEAKIGCTQPRRVAALSISRRIAEELGVEWGREVGCKIRFDDRSSPHSYLKLMTDGILLAETQGDPLLSEYNAIIIDEAHERSLNIDFLLGYLKGLLAKRHDLKLVITSATIDTESFSRAFNNAPIIEVSGRVYPVEVVYAPFDHESEERGDVTYIDAAVRAAEQALYAPGRGDLLIFMPGERDIRETCDLLEGRFGREIEIIPLFGLLSSGDQQRVFAPCSRRKVVVATNIAETSLTIPGIRYVIDAGLARISRYNPRTRTKRLPVEPISQSSANQRKGRSGRMQDGVCIRLYSEEEFLERPAYTQPEIQRANLAEVILRMKAFRLGDIETFPFINPPPPSAIQGGYALLQELGALDAERALTPLGESLSRLPIDPTLGRMLLQSQEEHATRELLIIAAGLSIQDPRERPLDKKEAAAAAHKRFADPLSDFLSLLRIWETVHDQWEKLRTQGQRRKFCREQFLSYLRMREWQDLHAQLHGALEELGRFKLNESNAHYAAIHRSILTGLLSHVATRKERNTYTGAGQRQLALFPGSALYERNENQPRRHAHHKQPAAEPTPRPTSQPQWIVAGEIVETSQLFVRTIAGIDPEWIIALAPHLCQVTHENPHWSVRSGSVLIEEKTFLRGLLLRKKLVAYGNINPADATKIFIRAALVEDELLPSQKELPDDNDRDDTRVYAVSPKKPALPPQYAFIEKNHQLRQKIETWQTRTRRHDLGNPDEFFIRFYAARIENVSSVHELNRLIRAKGGPAFLCATEADLNTGEELTFDSAAFPETVSLQGQTAPLTYAYQPGEERDGVTVRLGFNLAQSVSQACVEWAVPGLREGLIQELLRSLPKSLRRELMPFPPKVLEILRDFQPTGDSLPHDLARFIQQRYGVAIPPESWSTDSLPAHLRPRIEVVDHAQKSVGSGRDLKILRQKLEKKPTQPARDNSAWNRAAQKWERFGLTSWSFGDLPEQITVSDDPVLPVRAWPGLQAGDSGIDLRLFATADTARRSTLAGYQQLIELALQKDLAWMQKDLRALAQHQELAAGFCSIDGLQETAFVHLKRSLLPSEVPTALTEANFRAAVDSVRARIPGLAVQLIDRVGLILTLRRDVQRKCGPVVAVKPKTAQKLSALDQLSLPSPGAKPPENSWAAELDALIPPNFLAATSPAQLPQLPRYLKALATRMERAGVNPLKDRERAKLLAPYLSAWQKLREKPPESPEARAQIEELRWMIEEFKVSIFAQELGTAFPISAARLDQHLLKIRR